MELEVIDAKPHAVSQKIVLERRALPLPPLRMQMINVEDGRLVAYMRLHYFTHDGTKRMASAIREGEALGVDGYSKDHCIYTSHFFMEVLKSTSYYLQGHLTISLILVSRIFDVLSFCFSIGSAK